MTDRLVFLLLGLSLLVPLGAACDSASSAGDGGAAQPGSTTVTVGESVVFDEQSGYGRYSGVQPINANGGGFVALSTCGDVGVAYRDGEEALHLP